MFNFFFRPYVPGFRVRPDGVPGFNVDDNSLPQRASDSSDGTLPDLAAQRYPDAAQAQSPPSISFRLPGAKGWVLSAPLIGSPGFRISPQDDVPGFNVRPRNDVPGFNLDENGVQQQETPWSDGLRPGSVTPQDLNAPQPPTPPPGEEEPAPPAPPQLPEWLYKLVTMLPPRLSTAFDPRTGPRIEISSQPGLGSPAVPRSDQWPPATAPQQPAGIDFRSGAATTQNTNPQPLNEKASWRTWPQLPTDGSVYAQRARLQGPLNTDVTRHRLALPSMPAVRPVAESNFILASDRAAGDQQAPRQAALQEYQQRQPSAPPAAMAGDNQSRKPSTRMAALESEPERTSSQLVAAYRPPMEVESGTDDSRLIGQANAQVPKPQAAAPVDLSRRDAAGLPIGTILSSIRSPGSIGGNAINAVTPDLQPGQGQASAGGIAPDDLNIHLVGDGDSVEDLPRNKRHQRGVDASIADHVAKGFEIVDHGPRAVDVPGFLTPRLYDYIIRDPVTGRYYGVEVKTTIMSTIRLDRQQVEKDAVVVAQGAKVRLLNNVELSGVSYSVYCFGCEAFDVRSAVLLNILQNAGVPVVPGILPGDIRP
jgi:hypothetical protein